MSEKIDSIDSKRQFENWTNIWLNQNCNWFEFDRQKLFNHSIFDEFSIFRSQNSTQNIIDNSIKKIDINSNSTTIDINSNSIMIDNVETKIEFSIEIEIEFMINATIEINVSYEKLFFSKNNDKKRKHYKFKLSSSKSFFKQSKYNNIFEFAIFLTTKFQQKNSKFDYSFFVDITNCTIKFDFFVFFVKLHNQS